MPRTFRSSPRVAPTALRYVYDFGVLGDQKTGNFRHKSFRAKLSQSAL
jgi:hypothetical protein